MGQLAHKVLERNKGAPGGMYNVSYDDETITIHADGATPAAVNSAIQKLALQRSISIRKAQRLRIPNAYDGQDMECST